MAVETKNFTPDTAFPTSQPERYTYSNLIADTRNYELADFYTESAEQGFINLDKEITPDQATLEFSKFNNEKGTPKHEVGHLDAAIYYGYKAEATIIPGPGYLGLTTYRGFEGEDIKTRLWRGIVISLAGEVGAGCSDGCGSDFAKAHHYAHILTTYYNEGTVSSIISSAKSEAYSIVQPGSKRFKAKSLKLYHKKTI